MAHDYSRWTGPRSAGQWHDAVRDADRRGEFLLAHDLARNGLRQHPGDRRLQYDAVLALARSGATGQAMELYEACGLQGEADEDIAALGARILKDQALASTGNLRHELLAASAGRYTEIFRRTGGYFPGINGATLSFLAGDQDEATALAEQVDAACDGAVAGADGEAYWLAATRAEAALLLDRPEDARSHLAAAAAAGGRDYAAWASTRRQLGLICAAKGVDAGILEPIAPPPVIHYTGHMIAPPGSAGRFPAAAEEPVARRIGEWLDRRQPGFAYGSLACGADILFAEAALERGMELHVVLPFDAADFLETSVRRGGKGWEERFETCLGQATTTTRATMDRGLDDDVLFVYAAQIAMGLCLLRAGWLGTGAIQVAVRDGAGGESGAGTAGDVAIWQAHGHPSEIIRLTEDDPGITATAAPAPPPEAVAGGPDREIRAMLFGDIAGYSALDDRQTLAFQTTIMPLLAAVLDRHDDDIRYRNTWGDAIFVVFTGVVPAARCGLDIQEAFAAVDLAGVGLPTELGLRIGGHLGPVMSGADPVRGGDTFFGSHITRTARVEPVTPVGQIYVTGPFAAVLALEGGPDIACEYVGHLPTAKDFGAMRMHLVRRRPGGSEGP